MIERLQARAYRLLRWSEQYTKTDMVYLTRGGFWLGSSYVAQMVNALILSVALANLLPKEAYGTYQFMVSMVSIIAGLTLSGMGTSLMRAVAQGAQGTLAYAFKKQLQWSWGVVIASAIAAAYYLSHGNTGFAIVFVVTGVSSPFFAAFSLYRLYLEGKQLFKESAITGSWRRPLPTVIVVLTLLITHNPVAVVCAYFITQTLSTGLLYWLITRRYREPVQEHPELLAYSKHLSVMGIIALVMNNIDDVVIFHFLGPAQVAAYSLAQLPSIHINTLFGLGSNIIFPKFVTRSYETLQQTLWRKAGLFWIVCLGSVALYIVLSPIIFHILFPAYMDAVLLSDVLMLTVLFKPATLFNQVFAAHGMKGAQYFVQISMALVKLAALAVFIPLWGVWGAVWASVAMVAYWGAALSILFLMRKE
ncbi:MAG TPA: oligosaccharide flippase family protein [Candidatus Paceibacterota bacterium]|jgi:O-antigen/teichoic acid export membrane protein|nr:oligosaccharide flippase family protein [Candidatus Paceibacterota bacterium]